MKKHHLAVSVVAALNLTACAGTRFSWEDTAKVKNGMTEAEVIAILGQPYTRAQANGETTMMVWSFAAGFGSARAVSYRFAGGKVVGSTTINR